MEHEPNTYDLAVIGGGLAGLCTALRTASEGAKVILFEQYKYPFHKVCGEYISNETLPYLQNLGFNPFSYGAKAITRFMLTAPDGTKLEMPLDFGGFGLSRYRMDKTLADLATEAGAAIHTGVKVSSIERKIQGRKNSFLIHLRGSGSIKAKVVLGTVGKKNSLAPKKPGGKYVGVKHHIAYPFPEDLIALHNFKDGYCGISAVEDGRYCLCYLTTRSNLKKAGGIAAAESKVLSENPFLRQIFNEAEFLYSRPEVVHHISFRPKPPMHEGIIFCGDAAGMITPLCGNGMAMAIHGSKIFCDLFDAYRRGSITDYHTFAGRYSKTWKEQFAARMWVGRRIQQFFGARRMTNLFVRTFKHLPKSSRFLMSKTHGAEF